MMTIKNIIFLYVFISLLLPSVIMDKTLEKIEEQFPNSISIEHTKYKLPKNSVKTIQNTVRQKFFRPEVNLWEITDEDSSRFYGILDNVKGKSLPITFLTIFNDSSKVHYASIIKYREAYGGEVGNRSWLDQFISYNKLSSYKIGSDISGITGATISVHSVSKGIRKLSYLIDEIIKDNE